LVDNLCIDITHEIELVGITYKLDLVGNVHVGITHELELVGIIYGLELVGITYRLE